MIDFPYAGPTGEPYAAALTQALNWIGAHCKAIGIVVSGSIVRGNPHPNSDFDIFVIGEAGFRQRIQKRFNGVPCEIFINGLAQVYRYFEAEHKSNRPVTAHMLATGELVKGQEREEVAELIRAARKYASMAAPVTTEQLLFRRYAIATLFEDAADLIAEDPATAVYILNNMMAALIELLFVQHGLPLPRIKERLAALLLVNRPAGLLVQQYHQAVPVSEKMEQASQLVSMTVGETGFFEWATAPEEVPVS